MGQTAIPVRRTVCRNPLSSPEVNNKTGSILSSTSFVSRHKRPSYPDSRQGPDLPRQRCQYRFLPPYIGTIEEDATHIHRFTHSGGLFPGRSQHFFFNHKYSASVSRIIFFTAFSRQRFQQPGFLQRTTRLHVQRAENVQKGKLLFTHLFHLFGYSGQISQTPSRTRLRPLLLTRRSTLPVLAFCSASRYTLGTDTPYTNAIPLASCVFSYASTSKFRASLCSILLTSPLFYHFLRFIAISEKCSSGCLQTKDRQIKERVVK